MKKYSIAAIFVSLSLLYGCALESDCSSDEKRCIEVDETAYIETCNDGLWQRESNACASGLCDDDGKACLQTDCAPNDTHCDKDYGIKTCNKHGQWSEYTPCEAGLGCKYDGKSCAECIDDENYCENGVLIYCINGVRTTIKEDSRCECTNDDTRCLDSNKYEKCLNNEWIELSCQEGETCSDGKCTISGCKAGEIICSDGKLSTCDSGKWSAQLTCPYNNCKSTTECGECRNGSKACINNHNYGELQICINGTQTTKTCTTSCNAAGNACGNCINGNIQCSNNKQQTCVNGEWDAGTPCEFGCEGEECASITVPKADILDVVFQPDGTAKNKASSGLTIEPSGVMQVEYNDKLGRNVILFTGSNYYKVDYKGKTEVINKLNSGHSLEVVFAVSKNFSTSPVSKPLASHQAGGTGIEIGIDSDSGNQEADIKFVPYVSKYRYAQSRITPVVDKYYHVVGIWDKTTQKAYIYVDGVIKGTTEASGDLKLPADDAYKWFGIGADPGYDKFYFNGKIAIARIYSGSLTENQVKVLYKNTGLTN